MGSMKGVIYRTAPEVTIVDISHTVQSHSILEGALKLKSAYPCFPRDTIHVAVIDPGVGSERPILLARTENYFFLAPDNGLLTFVFHRHLSQKIISVTNSRYFLPEVSHTFHGRDIFAPVAAHLARGIPMEEFGPPVDHIQELEHPFLSVEAHRITGEIMYIDRFGNLISSIPKEVLEGKAVKRVLFKEVVIEELSTYYTQGLQGKSMALISSFGTLEIALYGKSAREALKVELHDKVTVEFE